MLPSEHLLTRSQGDFNVTAKYLAERPAWLKYGPTVDYRSLQVAMYNEEAWESESHPGTASVIIWVVQV